LRGYRKSQEIGKCLINTLKMALNLSNKKYYMASLDELTFSALVSLHCFKRFFLLFFRHPSSHMIWQMQTFSPRPSLPTTSALGRPLAHVRCVIANHKLDRGGRGEDGCSRYSLLVEWRRRIGDDFFLPFLASASVDIWSIMCHGECFEYIELH
jgi:hypothetical protein